MQSKGLILSIITIFLIYLPVSSQPNKYGLPLVTDYEYSITKGSQQNWCVTQDFRGVIYVGNNDNGVLEFDGVEWRSIPLPNNPIVRSIITGDNGVVYVGATPEFGYLAPDSVGNLQYRSLSDTIDQEAHPFSGVWKTHYVQGKVYFCTFFEIFIYDPELGDIEIIRTTEYAFFPYFISDTLYLGDFGEGLMRYNGIRFDTVLGGDFFKEKLVWGIEKYDNSRLLIATQLNGVFLYNTRTGKVDSSFVDPKLNEYFKSGGITFIVPKGEDFAVATMYSGLVILSRDGSARHIITKTEGLGDQTITSAYSNKRLKGSGPLWITHYNGIGKLEFNNPFRVFTNSSGFSNYISDIIFFNGKLFISTASGLYYKSSTSTSTGFRPVSQVQDDLKQLHVFKPSPQVELLLAFSESTAYVIDKNLRVTTIGENVINPPLIPEDREEYSGINLVQDPKQPDVIYTGRSQIIGLKYERGKWREISRIRDLPQAQLRKMVIDKFGYLWTSTDNRVFRIDISMTRNASMKSFDNKDGLPNSWNSQIFMDPNSGEILIGTVDGFYRYNYQRDKILSDSIYNPILPPGKNFIHNFYKDHEGDYWLSFENEYDGWTNLVVREVEDKMQILHDNPSNCFRSILSMRYTVIQKMAFGSVATMNSTSLTNPL